MSHILFSSCCVKYRSYDIILFLSVIYLFIRIVSSVVICDDGDYNVLLCLRCLFGVVLCCVLCQFYSVV